MASMFTYLWQSALVLTVLYLPFQLLLRKEHFFALNRAILLGILLLSLVLPLSRHSMPMFLDSWLHPEVEMEAAPIIPLGEYQDWDGDITIEEGDIEEPSSIEIHWTDLLIALWLLGTTLFLAWNSCGLWRLYRILHDKGNIREQLADGNTLMLTSTALPSFSWMHSIVISAEDFEENGETILSHECAHIAHLHSFDRLLLLVMQTIQWWNPFVWLLADALSQVHEYQADLAVLNQGINATQYQLLLIRKAAGPADLALVNGFKRNKLKLRIVMMNNMIKLRGAKCRYLALLPVVLMALALTAKAQEKTSEQEIESVKAVSIVYPDDIKIRTKDNTQDPLVLVEGEVYEDWKNIDPDIIESMTVYKADSDTVAHYSAIYEAAKYGVIMIELQEGKKQKPYQRKIVTSEETNEQAIRIRSTSAQSGIENVAEVKAGLMPPRENDDFLLQDVEVDLEKQPNEETAYKNDDVRVVAGGMRKDHTLAGIGDVIDSVLLKSREIGEEYQKKNPKAKKSVIIMKDSLWEVDGVQMTREEMKENYPKIPTEFQQLRKEAEPLTKKIGVNVVITDKE